MALMIKIDGKLPADSSLNNENKEVLIGAIKALMKQHKDKVEEFKETINKYEELLKEKDRERQLVELKCDSMQKSVNVLTTEDFKIKQIISLYAQGNSVGRCYNELVDRKRIDIEFEKVRDIVSALESKELEFEYLDFYEEEIKKFSNEMANYEEKKRIQMLRKYDEFQIVIEEYMTKLKEFGFDEEEMQKTQQILGLMKAYVGIVDSSSKIMKGLNGNGEVVEVKENKAQNVSSLLEQQTNNILVNFDPSSIMKVR